MMHNVNISDLIVRHKKFLLFLFIVSFVIRAAVFIGYLGKNENYWQVDSQTYHLVAQHVAQGKGLVSEDGSPHFYRLPGYPIFLGFFYYLFGVDTKRVLWPQIVIASCIPLLIFLLSLVLFPDALLVAQGASLWSAIHLGLVLYSGFFMTESLFIFLLLLFLIFFFSVVHLFFCRQKIIQSNDLDQVSCRQCAMFLPEPLMMDDSYVCFCEKCESMQQSKRYLKCLCEGDVAIKTMFWAGLFLGLASLFRPVGHYLLVLAGGMILFSHGSWRRKIIKVVTCACAWLLPVSFWLIRNVILTGHLFFHTLPGGHFLYLSAARVAMYAQHCSYQEARQHLHDEVHRELDKKKQLLSRPLLEIESCKIHEQLALKYFKQHPLIALKNWCTDMIRTMFSLYSAELLYLESGRQPIDYFKKGRSWWDMVKRYLFPQTESWILKGIVWFEILTFLLILLSFGGYVVNAVRCALARKFEPLCGLGKCLPFMALFIVIALSGGYARMRLPIEPLLSILSAASWMSLYRGGSYNV